MPALPPSPANDPLANRDDGEPDQQQLQQQPDQKHPQLEHGEDQNQQQQQPDQSPESAGLARGLARSAHGAASRAAVGRLPQQAAASGGRAAAAGTTAKAGRAAMGARTAVRTANKVVAKTTGRAAKAARQRVVAPPRAAAAGRGAARGGRVPVRRVVRASDRVSTGFDFVEAASVESDAAIETKERGAGWKKKILKVTNFIGTLAKNTILGAAVYTSYETTIERLHSEKDEDADDCSNDPYARASLPRHFGAGFLAGSVHAILSGAVDGAAPIWAAWRKGGSRAVSSFVSSPSGIGLASGALGIPYVLNHASSHAVLFGSYEMTKRFLLRTMDEASTSDDDEESDEVIEEDIHPSPPSDRVANDPIDAGDDMNIDAEDGGAVRYGQLLAVGTAGGVAGSVQHVFSSYFERWAAMAQEGARGQSLLAPEGSASSRSVACPRVSTSGTFGRCAVAIRSISLSSLKGFFLPLPTLRSTLIAFPPSAIGFVAFEYGRELVSD